MTISAETTFEWSVRALAQPAGVQLSLFPEFVCVADELALDFEQAHRNFQQSDAALALLADQASLITALDRRIESISGPQNARMWTDEALLDAPEWQGIRFAAQRVLSALGWSLEPPPLNRATYVSASGTRV